MSDIRRSLGPLEQVDDRWVLGDHLRLGSTWLELRTEGLYQHGGESEGQLIPWPRVMLVGFTLGTKYPPKGSYGVLALLGGLPGPWKGHGRGYLHMTLRHPYENWLASFDRHPRAYNSTELVLFQELLSQTASEGEADRLADSDWLGRAVELLVTQRPRTASAIREAVTRARQL
ncbi:hypothetical protein OOK13_41495 [Streptomyces sp. NBC_00378]|uniref:hypothetical protein n=1 Tax=unclassified Streptomyces TaxID=2593676 RepID=UPI00225B385E|nr:MULTISPECIES: hypothetical protein [unclassified Streptomyces]MCX5114817.1 hypothetical protein [Streptomyces sp. NBC_00378]